MARGITSFGAFTKTHTPGGTRYGCPYCAFFFHPMQCGNALGRYSRAVATIKRHVEAKHPDTRADNSDVIPGKGRL